MREVINVIVREYTFLFGEVSHKESTPSTCKEILKDGTTATINLANPPQKIVLMPGTRLSSLALLCPSLSMRWKALAASELKGTTPTRGKKAFSRERGRSRGGQSLSRFSLTGGKEIIFHHNGPRFKMTIQTEEGIRMVSRFTFHCI